MPSVDQNKATWNEKYDWTNAGEEWSSHWGSSENEWNYAILPRIHAMLPTNTILEIGPGFGRWTEYLALQCNHLILVDLSEQCIQACQKRFDHCNHIEYHVYDGKSLDFIPDQSVDFIFSFDSLVHAEEDVIQVYLQQLSRKMAPDAVGIIHHANMVEHQDYLAKVQNIPYRLRQALVKMGWIETLETQWRANSMSAEKFEKFAEQAGLQCISQELINWDSRHLIDCISRFTLKNSRWAQPNRVLRNNDFMREASYSSEIAKIYT